MLRFLPYLAAMLLIGPIIAGVMGTFLPAIGLDPTIGRYELSIEPIVELFATPGIWKSALLSLTIGLATTIISLVMVVLFFASWHESRLFNVIRYFLSPILSVPHAAAAFGFAFLIAPSGWIFRLFSPWLTGLHHPPDLLIINDPYGVAMTVGLIGKEIPFLFLITLAALPQSNVRKFVQISKSFGYGQTIGWLKSVYPKIYRQIRLPVLAVLAYSTSVVDVSIILGPTTPAPLAVRLLNWMNDPDLHMRLKAAAGAMFQLSISIAALAIWMAMEELAKLVKFPLFTDGRRYLTDGLFRMLSAIIMTLVTVSALLGLTTLLFWSVAGFWRFPDILPLSFTLQNWDQYLPELLKLISTTFVVGFLATLFSLTIILLCLENETRNDVRVGLTGYTVLFLPLLVPQVSFLFGLHLFFLYFGIGGTIWSVILIHMVFVMPYLYLSLSHQWHALDPHYTRISAGVGSSNFRTLVRVRIPLLLRAILTSSAVGFAVSVSQYLPTLLIGGGRVPTLTTEAVALASGGNRQVIAVHVLVQVILPFFGFLLAGLVPTLLYRNRIYFKVGK